ncbi:MAG: GxxExxY protein [Kofleriaceae bacterium]
MAIDRSTPDRLAPDRLADERFANARIAPDRPSDSEHLGLLLLRYLEEENRQGEGEGGEQKLRKSLYQPSEELLTLSGRFIGAAIEVHRHLGPGYPEGIYAKAVCRELTRQGIPFAAEVPLEIVYKEELLGEFRLDLIVYERFVVELKAIDSITSVHVAQVISYLKASGLRLGYIVNFNVPRLQHGIRRVTWSG